MFGDFMEVASFSKLISFRLGDGASASFWLSRWIGNTTLQNLYPRLFGISDRKDGVVKDMGVWVAADCGDFQLDVSAKVALRLMWKTNIPSKAKMFG
ncbi:hypothetical protein KIW84_023455 [Lathyrus oleraceus]|uniref:Uncharacterized protein n=1 Tax=Pisum sativum TaxID=3888 RepID=A0A9D5B808_PEA|nr:hypothetical protein KIW84_023455 [Pisum sativum]